MSNIRVQQHNDITWIDAARPDAAELAQYAQEYNLHNLHLEECLTKGQLPQVEIESDYLFLVLYFPHYNQSRDQIVTSQVGMFLGRNYVFTIHEGLTPTIRDTFKACLESSDEQDHYFGSSSAKLVYHLVRRLLEELSVSVHVILKELDEMDGRVFDSRASDSLEIGKLRQKIMRLRRATVVLKNVLSELASEIDSFAGANLSRYYENNAKTANKLWESIEEAAETIEIYKDADYTTSTEKTNKILAILTLLFTLTIPATVIGTFYGMNVLVPGGVLAGSWMFFGPYTAFDIVVGISVISAVVMYRYFKRKDWF